MEGEFGLKDMDALDDDDAASKHRLSRDDPNVCDWDDTCLAGSLYFAVNRGFGRVRPFKKR